MSRSNQVHSSMQIFVSRLVLILLAPVSLAAVAVAGDKSDWPGFRGVRVDGIVTDAGVFASGRAIRLEIGWKKKLGSGYSGVSVADGRLVTAFSDGETDFVVALDPHDGNELWRYKIDAAYEGHDGSHDGPIATPLVVQGRVFGLSPRGKLFALDAKTGAELWATEQVADQDGVKPHYGYAASPLIVDGVLIALLGGKEAFVGGFDPASGKRLWTAGGDAVAYQTPVPIEIDGRTLVVAAGNTKLYVIDPSDGRIALEYDHGGSGPRGAQSLVPVPIGDGRLLLTHKPDAAVLLKLSGDGETITATVAWEQRTLGKSYCVPVYHDGRVYGYNSRIFTCLDASTGEFVWRSRQPGDGFAIVVDGHLVTVTKKGSVHIARTGGSGYDEIARLDVFEDGVWTPPGFADGSIFVRSLGEIARIEIRAAETALTEASGSSKGSSLQTDITGSRFARFLESLKTSADKPGAIEKFIDENKPFPLIEDGGLVHFVYHGPASDDVAFAGDLLGIGNDQPMTRVAGTDLYYFSQRLAPDTRVNYAIMKDFLAIVDPLNPRTLKSTLLNEDMELARGRGGVELSWLGMPDYQPPAHVETPSAARRGRVETHELESEVLGAKHTVQVYLPHGYESGTQRYPVAYVHGGTAAREQGKFINVLDNLIGTRIEPVIAVFADQAGNPFDPAAGQAFVKMIGEELVPFIDRTYRTIDKPQSRASIGAGFGSLTAMLATFTNEGIGKLGVQSPYMIDTKLIEAALKPAADGALRVYLDWGKYDLRTPGDGWSVVETAAAVDKLLRERGHKPLGGMAHDGTGYSSWNNRTDELLEVLFPLKRGD